MVLSGIPVFQVSRYAAKALDEKKKVRVYVDFMPGWDNSESFRLLKKRALLLAYKPAAELFTGMLNRKLAQVLLKLAGNRWEYFLWFINWKTAGKNL